jgi:hypothetical protein
MDIARYCGGAQNLELPRQSFVLKQAFLMMVDVKLNLQHWSRLRVAALWRLLITASVEIEAYGIGQCW